MHYFAYVSIPRFYSTALAAKLSCIATGPIAVSFQKQILDLNDAAAKAGVRIGMPLSEAKALLQDPRAIHAYDPSDYILDQQIWLNNLARASDAIRPGLPHDAVADLTAHPDPLTVASDVVDSLLKLPYREISIGLAPTTWMARLCSAACSSHSDVIPFVADPARFLAERRIEDLLPLSSHVHRRLRFLGYRTVGEIAALPLPLLKSQFGSDAWTIHQCAIGVYEERFHPTFPDRSLTDSIEPPGGAIDWTSVKYAIRKLSTRLGKKLRARDWCARKVIVSFTLASGKRKKLERTYSKPISTARDVERAVGLMLLVESLLEPIIKLEVELPELESTQRVQRRLDETHESRERKLSADMAFRAIKHVYGDHAIQVASELPTPRHVRVMRAWKDATGW